MGAFELNGHGDESGNRASLTTTRRYDLPLAAGAAAQVPITDGAKRDNRPETTFAKPWEGSNIIINIHPDGSSYLRELFGSVIRGCFREKQRRRFPRPKTVATRVRAVVLKN